MPHANLETNPCEAFYEPKIYWNGACVRLEFTDRFRPGGVRSKYFEQV